MVTSTEMSWVEILGLIVFPFLAIMSGVAIIYNKFSQNIPKDKKR